MKAFGWKNVHFSPVFLLRNLKTKQHIIIRKKGKLSVCICLFLFD